MGFKEFLRETKEDFKPSIGKIDESGAGIKRVMSQLQSDKSFAIISAFRFTNSKKENIHRNNHLIKEVRAELGTKTGAYKLVGHWKECSVPLKDGETIKDCKGKVTNALEESWLILKPDDISDEVFEKAIQKQAQKYEQDGYIIRNAKGLFLKSKTGEVWEKWGDITKDNLKKGFEDLLSRQGYTELKKDRVHGRVQSIVFESFDIDLVVPDDSISSKMLFGHANILY